MRGAALAALAYLAGGLAVTWPMPANMRTQIFGTGGDDNWALISYLRELTQHNLNPFQAGRIPDLAAPEGLVVEYALNLVQWPSLGLLYVLTEVFGAVGALNLFVLLGFVLNGTAMFLLVRRLTGHAGAAFVCGVAFAFGPRMVVGSMNHQYFVHGWVLVLLAWRLLELSDHPTRRNGVLAGLAAIWALSWNPYYILFGAVLYGVFVARDAYRFVRARAPRGALAAAHAVSAGMTFAVFVVYALVARGAEGRTGASRPISEAYVYSSRPHEYVLPDARHPVLGRFTDDVIWNHLHGSGYGEINSYLGWSILVLAAVALVAVLRKRLDPLDRGRVWLFGAVAVAGALFSAPPTMNTPLGALYLPPWFVYQVTESWRAFNRILPVVALGVVVLAGYGLARLLRGRTPRATVALTALATVVVAFDLAVEPFQRTQSVPDSPIYDVLREQPGRGLVAEYPILPDKIPIYEAKVVQDEHDRPLLNGFVDGTLQEARALDLADVEDPRTAPRLALLGVRWIVVFEGATGRDDAPPAGTPGRGFRFIERSGNRALYEVTARPAASWVAPGDGFHGREGAPGDEYHWMRGDEATLQVLCSTACGRTLSFGLQSFHRPRTVVMRAGGRELGRFTAGVEAIERHSLRLPAYDGSLLLDVEVAPGAENVRETTGAADLRDLSVLFHEPKVGR